MIIIVGLLALLSPSLAAPAHTLLHDFSNTHVPTSSFSASHTSVHRKSVDTPALHLEPLQLHHVTPVVHATPVLHSSSLVHVSPEIHTDSLIHAAPVAHTTSLVHAPAIHTTSLVHASPEVHATHYLHAAPMVHSSPLTSHVMEYHHVPLVHSIQEVHSPTVLHTPAVLHQYDTQYHAVPSRRTVSHSSSQVTHSLHTPSLLHLTHH